MRFLIPKTIKNKFSNTPKGLFVLFYTEAQELFGRFGITALLVLYLTKYFHIADAKAFTIFSSFIALIYITPLLGGFLSDRYLGFKRAVIVGGITMAIGNALLVIPKPIVVYLGLAIVAIGSGFFTPTLAAMVGKLYPKMDSSRDTGFTIYYIGKNIGALLAPIFCGIVGQYFGLNYAFILSTLGMISGVIVFWLGRKHLKDNIDTIIKVDSEHRGHRKFNHNTLVLGLIIALIPIVLFIITQEIAGYLLLLTGFSTLSVIGVLLFKVNKIERHRLLFIVIMLCFVVIFYAYLSQGGTTLSLFIDRIVQRHIFGITIPTSVFLHLRSCFYDIVWPLSCSFLCFYR